MSYSCRLVASLLVWSESPFIFTFTVQTLESPCFKTDLLDYYFFKANTSNNQPISIKKILQISPFPGQSETSQHTMFIQLLEGYLSSRILLTDCGVMEVGLD